MIVAVPFVTPKTDPVALFTEATDASLLLHEPPETVLDKVEETPLQSEVVPVIEAGAPSTSTLAAVALVSVPVPLQVPAPAQVIVQ